MQATGGLPFSHNSLESLKFTDSADNTIDYFEKRVLSMKPGSSHFSGGGI